MIQSGEEENIVTFTARTKTTFILSSLSFYVMIALLKKKSRCTFDNNSGWRFNWIPLRFFFFFFIIFWIYCWSLEYFVIWIFLVLSEMSRQLLDGLPFDHDTDIYVQLSMAADCCWFESMSPTSWGMGRKCFFSLEILFLNLGLTFYNDTVWRSFGKKTHLVNHHHFCTDLPIQQL